MAVDTLSIKVNGDFHEFDFSGQAQDLVDTEQLSERAIRTVELSGGAERGANQLFDYSGKSRAGWLGSSPARFFTLTNAKVTFSE